MSAFIDVWQFARYDLSMHTDRRPPTLTNRVRERRRALGLTQQALATRVGVTRQTVIKIERQPGYDVAKLLCVRLADALDVEESWLFTALERAS